MSDFAFSGVEIRPADEADLDAVLDLWAAARSPHAATPDDGAAVGPLLYTGSLLVAERGDATIVGTLIAAWDGWRGNMYRLAVAESARRAGIGRALVAAGEVSLRARGAKRITALVAKEDDTARRLWLAANYQDDASIGRFVRNL